MAQSNYLLTSSPHVSAGLSTQKIMGCVVVALTPQCIAGIVFFGIPAFITIITCITSCILFEFLFQKATKQKVTVANLSAMVSGMMLSLVLPPTIPIWQAMLGSLVAVVVAKGLFGGLGSNVFNPALTGRAALFISFPVTMGSTWVVPERIAKTFEKAIIDDAGNTISFKTVIDTVAEATPLATSSADGFIANGKLFLQYLVGYKAGCIGEVSILLILISAAYLLYEHIIDIRAPVAMLATVFIATFFYSINKGANIAAQQALLSLLTGGVMFGSVFMVTDYATTPVTKLGRIVFGVGCGLITFLIRKFGSYPEGVMFSILIMNAFAPLLNNLTGRMYGYKK